MSDRRTMDCEAWARRRLKSLGPAAKGQLLEIRPKTGFRVLGGIRIPPNNELFWPSPPWHHHFAAVSGGLAMDEIYPAGVPIAQYKSLFEHEDAISFELRDP